MESPYHLSLLIKLSNETKSIIIALLLILYCVLQWRKKNTSTTKGKIPPQPSNKWPIIGHLHLLKGLPHITLAKLADQYGPIFMIKLGVRQALVVSTPEMAKECLGGTNDKVFLNRLQHTVFLKHMTYNSAMFGFSPYGQYWRELRKIATIELLSNHRVEMFRNVRVSEIRSAIKEISGVGSNPIDMKQWFGDISVNTIVRLVAGKSLKEFYQGEEYDQWAKVISDFFEMAGAFVPGDALPFLRWFDIGGFERRMKKGAKQVDHLAQRWLEDHKKDDRNSLKEKRDFLDVLLGIYDSRQETPSEFDTDTIIKATCMQMVLAAADTTSVTLTWALSSLLNNKDVLKKTQAELDTVVGKGRLVEESDLKNLIYLQAVLKETMRLHPAGPLSVPRESITDCIVSGYHIPVGTQLYVNLYKIHRDPQVWEDPLDFNPERFLTTRGKDYDLTGQNAEFMPFGSGRRICPGISYAQSAMQFTLANLLHGFEISIPVGETIDMTEGFGLTCHKVTPLKVILTQRMPSSPHLQ